jgi:hypothetical protein
MAVVFPAYLPTDNKIGNGRQQAVTMYYQQSLVYILPEFSLRKKWIDLLRLALVVPLY